jgi:chromosome segregation ATPase
MPAPATPAKPRGLSRAEREATANKAFLQNLEQRRTLEGAQQRNAVRVKLGKLARREPMVNALLRENVTLQASLKGLQEKNAELEKNYAIAAARVLELDTGLTAERQAHAGTTANLETAHRELGALRTQIEHLGKDLDKARAELAAALKSKRTS